MPCKDNASSRRQRELVGYGIPHVSLEFPHPLAGSHMSSYSSYMALHQKLPLPLGRLGPHLTHDIYGPPESPTQTASRSVQPFLYESQLLRSTMRCQWGRKPQNCPFPLGFCHPAGKGPSHSNRQHAPNMVQIVHVVRQICSRTDGHTDTQTRAHCSTSPPLL